MPVMYFIKKRELRVSCARFSTRLSEPADPNRMIGTRAWWEEKQATRV